MLMIKTTPPAASATGLRRRRCHACPQKPRALRPRISSMTEPWIKPAVDEIRREVAQERDHAVHDDHAHDESVIAVDRPLDQIAAATGKPKHCFNHERARDDKR